MNEKDQLQAFADDLDKLVNRYRDEFDLTYGAVVGALQMKSWLLCSEAQSRRDEVE